MRHGIIYKCKYFRSITVRVAYAETQREQPVRWNGAAERLRSAAAGSDREEMSVFTAGRFAYRSAACPR